MERLFEFYRQNEAELVRQYDGKYLVITKDGVVGVWDSDQDAAAYQYARKQYGMGNFMLHFCSSNPQANVFHCFSNFNML